MNVLKKNNLIFLTMFFVFGCAMTPKEKILKNMLIGAATGIVIGQMKSENKTGYSLLYAGAISSIAGAGSVWYSDLDEDSERIIKENQN
jgi:hypothetical protein